MGLVSLDVITFDLGPILQGQTRMTKLKSAYNSLIIGVRGWECETHLIFFCGFSPTISSF